jgi:hypothetical protein
MNFKSLPAFAQLNILVQADPEDFDEYIKIGHINPFYEERVYEERVRKFFSLDLIQFKPKEMKWKEFYNRLNDLFYDFEHGYFEDDIGYYMKNNHLLEIQIYAHVYPEQFELNFYKLINTAIYHASLDISKWLLNINPTVTIEEYNIDESYRNTTHEFVEFLISKGYRPDYRNIDMLLSKKKFNILEKLNIMPNYHHANAAVDRGDISSLLWLEKYNILPDAHKITNAIASDRLDIVKFMVHLGYYPNHYELNYVASPKIREWLVTNNIPVREN